VASGRSDFKRAQRRWADAHGVGYDALGCVRDLADNLLSPLDTASLDELARGSELTPGVVRPARLYSLCSSAALVVNVFGHWRGRDPAHLLAALGVEAAVGARLAYEEPLPTGLAGDPPTVDVALWLRGGRCVAVESKYGEWLVPRPRNKRVFKDKYFPPGAAVWTAAGLPRCQALAEDLQSGRERLRFLNAAQLLKHALGLKRNCAPDSVLVYLYYDRAGRETAAHRAELERVAARVQPEVDLRVTTYQALFAALRADSAAAPAYLAYLERRYFA
jgi:hypothetical protein